MAIKYSYIFIDNIDKIVKDVNDSLSIYTSEEYTSEDISNIIFDRLVAEDVSARIIMYTVVNNPFFSVQYYKGKWVNFDYTGLDMYFQPVYHETLNPTNIVKEEMINNG